MVIARLRSWCRCVLQLILNISHLRIHCNLLEVNRAERQIVVDLISVKLGKILGQLAHFDHFNFFLIHIKLRLLIQLRERNRAVMVNRRLLELEK